MTWFKVDDSFHGHPKLADLESGPSFAEAVALWTLAGSWCASHLTDGRVPATALRRLVPFDWRNAAAELVRVGLWHAEDDGGYRFHGWHDYQPTAASVEAERAASRGRLQRWREKNRNRSAVVGTSVGTSVDDAVDASVTALHTPSQTPHVTPHETPRETVTPTRPDPTRISPNGDTARDHEPTTTIRVEHSTVVDLFGRLRSEAHQAKHGRPGGTYRRGPRDWQPVEDLCAWAAAQPEPAAALEDSLRGYLADEWAAGAGWPISAWAKDPGRYNGRLLPQEGTQEAAKREEATRARVRELRDLARAVERRGDWTERDRLRQEADDLVRAMLRERETVAAGGAV